MNNLGGFRKIEFFFIDEITSFIRNGDDGVRVGRREDAGLELPLHDNAASLFATPDTDDGGTLYTHQCTIPLRAKALKEAEISLLRQVKRRGCLLLATTNNDDIRVFGSKEYPLSGTLKEDYGSRRSELHQYELQLSCVAMHPELKLL